MSVLEHESGGEENDSGLTEKPSELEIDLNGLKSDWVGVMRNVRGFRVGLSMVADLDRSSNSGGRYL